MGSKPTIISVTYNSSQDLMASWNAFRPEWAEWIVVDNNSADESVRVAESLGARVIALDENVGFSTANNIGVESSNGDVLIFGNPDLRVDQAGIEMLSETALGYAGLVAPQLVNADGSLQENGRGTPFPHRKVRHLLSRKHRQSDPYLRFASEPLPLEVVWVMGAAVSMRRDVFDTLGGWDGRFFIYYEDADICLRAWEEGLRVCIDGRVRWQHGWARETAGSFSRSAWKNEFRSAWRFYRKHLHCVVPLGRRARLLHAVDQNALENAGPQ
jgi:N-acetylglucosaminyl-diphospho-decaprenol L-rhamnosyltransferase